MRQHALPFPVRTPFGIDVHAVKPRKRPFAPRHQVFQQVFDAVDGLSAGSGSSLSAVTLWKVQTMRGQFGRNSTWPVPFNLPCCWSALPGGLGGFQPVNSWLLAIVDKMIDSIMLSPDFQRHQRPKLKHWNRNSACSNPALCRRALCRFDRIGQHDVFQHAALLADFQFAPAVVYA